MKKIILVLSLFLCSCAPGGTVVYERSGSGWRAKEVHFEFQHITTEGIENGRQALEEYAP